MLPQAHGATDPPAGTHHLDVRDAAAWVDLLRGVDVVCHQAAVVGAGVRVGDLPDYAGHNDLGTAALLAAMHEAGVGRLVLASSMVVYGEGRYRCSEHGVQVPPPREVAALEAGDFENHCPRCSRALEWALVDEGARLDPRSSYAASKVAQEHYTVGVGAAGGRAGGGAALPQRLRPGDAAGHAVLRGGRAVPLLPGARGAAAGLRGRRPGARLRARHRRGPRQPGRAARGGRQRRRRRTPPTTWPPGTRSASSTWPGWWPRAPAGPSRPRSPAATGSATCATSSPRRRGRRRSSASPPRSSPEQGLPAFATAPLRA